MPVESENRTVMGMTWPVNSGDLLNAAAWGEARKLPSATTPFA